MSDSGIEIILVEDNPNDAELIIRVFKKHNITNKFILFKDGAEAMDYLFTQNHADTIRPKVILLDLKLPKLNGIEVLRRLKADERTQNIPVVVVTSSREDRDLKAAYELGANSYVTKPIKFDEFAKAVSELGLYWMMLNKPVGA